ncbi:hypothetical protein [Deinococcus ruber]|uniref:Uncharacterized protein n=1 Tax=Deinococcus ruber TaxID=1848197 RepID=A0A918FES8_9DEIO|nr:hypothetical protein [Deinococcus ruber]GGR31454.1 hypothetical protein GCM10008957_47710 [Deinococcus ruber]
MIGTDQIAALLAPVSAHVLTPERIEEPLQGGKGGTERASLSKYLSDKAEGYVQLYELTPTFTYQGVYDTYLLTVDAVADTKAAAVTLAAACRKQLSSTPRRGGNITTFMPERVEALPGGIYRVTVQFEVRQARTEE